MLVLSPKSNPQFNTHKRPIVNIAAIPIRFLRGIARCQMIGTGMMMIIKSVTTSVAQNTVSIFKVLEHFVRNQEMSDQFQSQWTPHWKTVAPVNATPQAAQTPIIIQQAIRNFLIMPKNLIHSSRIEILIRAKAGFSQDWKYHLYLCDRISSGVVTGQSSDTGECPPIGPSTTPAIKLPFKLRTSNC